MSSNQITKTIREPAKNIKVFKEADVVVVGGGPAGVAAAVAAARNGASTILVERYGHLGGLATGGLVLVIMPMSDGTKKQQIAGLCQEMVDRLDAMGGAIHPRKEDLGSSDEKLVGYWRNYPFCVIEGRLILSVPFDPEAYKCVLNNMVEESGVKLLLHSWGTKAIMEKNQVKGVIFESKSGRQAILGKVIVDTTGDGDIFATAGADFDGKIEKKLRATLALPFRIGGIDFKKYNEFRRTEQQKYDDFTRELESLGGYPRGIRYSHEDAVWVNNQIEGRDGLSIEDLTWVELDVRKKMLVTHNFLKKNMPGYENSFIMDTAPQIGVRCTRRLIGEYVITEQDCLKGVVFPDTIGVFPDHHHILSPEHPHWHIPYRALVSRNIDGLLAAGRCLSADMVANELLRPIQGCIIMGEAAGTAAAIAVKDKVSPRNVNISILQKALKKQGVILPNIPN